MKKLRYLILPLIAFAFVSCKKNSNNIGIKEYDDNQIQAYIHLHGLTNMKKDTSSGDTTGIYYEILSQGTASVVDYPTLVSYAYSYHTFDGAYATTDTIANHTNTYLGHVSPSAVQMSIKNILKNKGGRIRLLIPSRLAFGTNGYYSGGITINGNQCLDYTISLVNNDPMLDALGRPIYSRPRDGSLPPPPPAHCSSCDIVTHQTAYDSLSITKYIAANGLTGYHTIRSASGYNYYYKIITPGTGTAPISLASTVGVNYTGYLLNGATFDSATTTDGTAATSFTLYDVVDGFSDALTHTTAGGVISFIIPSALGYGDPSGNSGAIPAFSCLRFDVTVVSVTN